MDSSSSTGKVNRRNFLTGVAVAGAAAGATALDGGHARAETPRAKAAPPSASAVEAETSPPPALASASGRPGSDFMVDVIKSLGIDYVATNPASSCRGLHESIINYGNNEKPELLTVMHEESGGAMAHGYAKAAGRPMGLLFHGTVGLQHAAMAIYNAWCDRVPMIILSGNHVDAASRPPGTPTFHAAQDPLALVRDFTKWDDQPASLQHCAESLVRAYKVAMTPPLEPVCLSIDAHLQEHPIHEGERLVIPKLTQTKPPQGEADAVREAARLLVRAQNPVIVVDRAARTAKGMELLVALAETLNAAVVDQYGRQNFPSRHHLNQTDRGRQVIGQADVILGLELADFWGTVNGYTDNPEQTRSSRIKPGTTLISIGVGDLYIRANYQDFQRYQPVDLAIGADAEATLPVLIEAVKVALTAEARDIGEKRAEAFRKAQAQARERMRAAAAIGWDATPVSTARLSAELWAAIRNEDWALVSRDSSVSNWPHRMWNFDKYHRFNGGPGGQGIGYGLPAAVGAALAHRAHGRFCVNIQNDGDLMYAPGALWTAVHHRIPLLTVMHNNRAYHQEIMHVQRIGNWRNRGVDRAHIGTTIADPHISYAKLAESMGMAGLGPIEDPADLGPALQRAVQMVKAGEPVLVDVVTQPR